MNDPSSKKLLTLVNLQSTQYKKPRIPHLAWSLTGLPLSLSLMEQLLTRALMGLRLTLALMGLH